MDEEAGALYRRIQGRELGREEALAGLGALRRAYEASAGERREGPSEPGAEAVYVYDEPYLRDHLVEGRQVILGLTYAGLALEGFLRRFPEAGGVSLRRLSFVRPVEVRKGGRVALRLAPRPADSFAEVRIEYREGGGGADWAPAAVCRMAALSSEAPSVRVPALTEGLEPEAELEALYPSGGLIRLGESYKIIRRLYRGEGQVVARAALSAASRGEGRAYALHPLLLNSAFSLLSAWGKGGAGSRAYLPFGVKELRCWRGEPLEACWVRLHSVREAGELVLFDADLISEGGSCAARLIGASVKRVRAPAEAPAAGSAAGSAGGPSGGLAGAIEEYLRGKAAAALGAGELDAETPLLDLGIESAELVGLAGELERELAVELDPTLFFEYPSLRALAVYFEREQGPAFGRLLSRAAAPAAGGGGASAPGGRLEERIEDYLTARIKALAGGGAALLPETSLLELGVESAQLVEMANELEGEAGIELDPTLFFEFPSVRALAGYLAAEHPGVFERLTGAEAGGAAARARPAEGGGAAGSFPGGGGSAGGGPGADIAIIGLHGRFAAADTLAAFWANLREERDLMREVPLDHWDVGPWYDPDPQAGDKTYCKWGSFIDGVDQFDAGFFKISPREAEFMDPQVRLFLQSVYAAAEDAGVVARLRGSNTGVFAGICFNDYSEKMVEMKVPLDPYTGTGVGGIAANRVSFWFDFTGPSFVIDTACSSSLFALHSACLALRNGECDMAFAGGANLLLSSLHYRYFSAIRALSPSGRCHSFDAAADGYAPGECVGSLLLKPLGRAERDGDQIHAVIKGSAALHGGAAPSLTAPSVSGEENVILKAWENAGIDPADLSYIEAHGTGTPLGDPIEITSLTRAFKRFTEKRRFCAVGSVKSNIGHAEGAAGIAGVLKVVQQMKQGQVPPLGGFKRLNPYIRLDGSALYIPDQLADWPRGASPRTAGVSSFGFSGAYAHVVLQEYPGRPARAAGGAAPAEVAVVLSARDEERLAALAERLAAFLAEGLGEGAVRLGDFAYTLQLGREAMNSRWAFVARSREEALAGLRAGAGGGGGFCGDVRREAREREAREREAGFAESLEGWLRGRDWPRLLSYWVQGGRVDWALLWEGAEVRRISLPTYPFAPDRYWLAPPEAAAPAEGSGGREAGGGAFEEAYHARLLDQLAGRRVRLEEAVSAGAARL
nr:LasN [uncultured Verrucomicrobiota bacterium]UWK15775.1 LasN [uncultured Verrucomicrobiota bacterium]